MYNLKQNIVSYKFLFEQVKKQEEEKRKSHFEKQVDKHRLLLEKLKDLKEFGIHPTLHLDKKHCPCPAIHIRNIGDYSEFYVTEEDKIKACHHSKPRTFKTDEEFLSYVAKTVAQNLVDKGL